MDGLCHEIIQFFLNLERETKTFYSNVAVGCKLWPDIYIYIYIFQKKSMGFFLPKAISCPKPLAKKWCITLPPKATFNPTSPHLPIACAGAKELQTWMKKCWKFPVIRAYGATGKETKGAWVDICTRENIRTPHFIIQSRAADHHTTRYYWDSWDGFLLFWRDHHLAWFSPKSLPKSSHFPRSWKS